MAARDWTDDFFDPLDDAADDLEEMSIGRFRAETVKYRERRTASVDEALRLRGERQAESKAQFAQKQQLATKREQRMSVRDTEAARERTLRREAQTAARQREQDQRDAAAEYRQRRDAERQAYREQMDAERRQRRESAARTPASFTTGTQGFAPEGSWNPDKAAVAKFIIFVTALGAIAGVANDLTQNTQPIKLQNGVKIPAHLRTLGGTFIAGAVSLLVNEIYPAAGAVMGAGMVGLVVIPNLTQLIPKLGGFWSGGAGKVGGGGIAGGNEKFDPSTGLITGDRGTFRLVPVGGGNYSVEPVPSTPTQPGPGPGGTFVA